MKSKQYNAKPNKAQSPTSCSNRFLHLKVEFLLKALQKSLLRSWTKNKEGQTHKKWHLLLVTLQLSCGG